MKSAPGERRKAGVLGQSHGTNRVLGELEDQRRRDRAVGVDEFEQLREARVGQRRGGKIAEQADAVLGIEPGQRLVIAHLALRQSDDGLQVQIDPAAFDGGADGGKQRHQDRVSDGEPQA